MFEESIMLSKRAQKSIRNGERNGEDNLATFAVDVLVCNLQSVVGIDQNLDTASDGDGESKGEESNPLARYAKTLVRMLQQGSLSGPGDVFRVFVDAVTVPHFFQSEDRAVTRQERRLFNRAITTTLYEVIGEAKKSIKKEGSPENRRELFSAVIEHFYRFNCAIRLGFDLNVLSQLHGSRPLPFMAQTALRILSQINLLAEEYAKPEPDSVSEPARMRYPEAIFQLIYLNYHALTHYSLFRDSENESKIITAMLKVLSACIQFAIFDVPDLRKREIADDVNEPNEAQPLGHSLRLQLLDCLYRELIPKEFSGEADVEKLIRAIDSFILNKGVFELTEDDVDNLEVALQHQSRAYVSVRRSLQKTSAPILINYDSSLYKAVLSDLGSVDKTARTHFKSVLKKVHESEAISVRDKCSLLLQAVLARVLLLPEKHEKLKYRLFKQLVVIASSYGFAMDQLGADNQQYQQYVDRHNATLRRQLESFYAVDAAQTTVFKGVPFRLNFHGDEDCVTAKRKLSELVSSTSVLLGAIVAFNGYGFKPRNANGEKITLDALLHGAAAEGVNLRPHHNKRFSVMRGLLKNIEIIASEFNRVLSQINPDDSKSMAYYIGEVFELIKGKNATQFIAYVNAMLPIIIFMSPIKDTVELLFSEGKKDARYIAFDDFVSRFFQHLPRWSLFLKDMIKHTPDELSDEKAKLVEILDFFEQIVNRINSVLDCFQSVYNEHKSRRTFALRRTDSQLPPIKSATDTEEIVRQLIEMDPNDAVRELVMLWNRSVLSCDEFTQVLASHMFHVEFAPMAEVFPQVADELPQVAPRKIQGDVDTSEVPSIPAMNGMTESN